MSGIAKQISNITTRITNAAGGLLPALMLALSLLTALPAFAQNVHGVLRVVKGDVQIKSAKTGQMVKARLGEQVFPKDVIITGKDARAKIVMVDNNEINVSPESQIEIQHYEYDPAAGKKDVLLNVIYGKVRAKVEQKYDGKSAKFQVKTPAAVAGVRGTDFLASYDRGTQGSNVVTFQGKVEFGTPGPNGTIMNAVFVTPGNSASSVNGAAPAAPAPVPKAQLANMDKESKADTAAPAKPDSAKERQPSSEKGDKKDDGKGATRVPASSGGSMIDTAKDTPAGANSPEMPCANCGPQAPPPPPPAPPLNVINKPCDFCTQAIQSGNSNVHITVKTN